MHKGKIAVDGLLEPVRERLIEKGYEILPMDRLVEADCVVVSGGDSTVMGVETSLVRAPVIAVLGMSPEDVVAAVEHRMR